MNDTPIKPYFPCVRACEGFPHRHERTHANMPKNSKNNPPLGNIRKSQVSVGIKGLEPNSYNSVIARVERFALQDMACDILPLNSKKSSGKPIKHNIKTCLKCRITKTKGVTVFYNEKRKKAQYGNLQLCKSVWDCPVCSMRISEGRGAELRQGINNWKKKGGSVYLVTFTNRHHFGDVLDDLLGGQKNALINFWQKNKIKDTLKVLGYKGRITATEVTYSSANGWHPHYHMLFFFEQPINEKSLKYFLATEWQKSCIRVGLKEPSIKRGVDVRDGMSADEYVSKFGKDQKWGLDKEVTKWHSKKGFNDSFTPWDFLRMAINEPNNYKWRKLFREYADCFHGRRQLSWSPNLSKLLGVKVAKDEELAEQKDNESIEIKELSLQIWDLIKRSKKRAEFLHAVELDYIDGTNRANDLIMKLAKAYIKKVIDTS